MNTSSQTKPVVVGFDGTDFGYSALDVGLDEAKRRHTEVVVLLASGAAMLSTPLVPMMSPWPDEVAADLLKEATSYAATRSPEVTVQTKTALSDASAALIAASSEACLVVIGGPRHSRLGELFLGATAPQVAAHAQCPVIVVPRTEPAPSDAPIVVGVDGSAPASAALGYAFEQAHDTGRPLHAVHAWWLDVPDRVGLSSLSAELLAGIERGHRKATAAAVDPWAAKFPDVKVETTCVQEDPVIALAKAGKEGALIVVGSRGHGGFAGLLVGSVTQGLLHTQVACPIIVVHSAQAAQDGAVRDGDHSETRPAEQSAVR